MGYTNYYTPKQFQIDQVPAQFWHDTIKVLDKIIEQGVQLADWNGNELFNSGFEIVNATLMSDEKNPSICFNGYGEKSYETFDLRFNGKNEFCKTGRCDYDLAVKCVLILAEKYELLEQWDFDGEKEDEEYQDAYNLLKELKLIE